MASETTLLECKLCFRLELKMLERLTARKYFLWYLMTSEQCHIFVPTKQCQVFVTMFQDAQDFHRRLHARTEASKTRGHPLYNNPSTLFLVYDSVANDVREVCLVVGLFFF